MTIKVNSTIEKLDPNDTYKIINANDIEGLDIAVTTIIKSSGIAATPFFGMFGTNWPTTKSGMAQSTNSKVTLTKNDDVPVRAFIAIPLAIANNVSGIKEEGGIASQWQSDFIDMDGDHYKIFVSPHNIAERTATFIVEF